jgi:hypothetical protein
LALPADARRIVIHFITVGQIDEAMLAFTVRFPARDPRQQKD